MKSILYLLILFNIQCFSQTKWDDKIRGAIIEGNLASLKKCIEKGATINPSSSYSQSLLMLAAKYPNKEIVNELILNKARVNYEDFLGRTALLAASSYGHPENVKLLKEHGALGPEGIDKDHYNCYGKTFSVGTAMFIVEKKVGSFLPISANTLDNLLRDGKPLILTVNGKSITINKRDPVTFENEYGSFTFKYSFALMELVSWKLYKCTDTNLISKGTLYDHRNLKLLKIGASTIKDVEELIGKPYMNTTSKLSNASLNKDIKFTNQVYFYKYWNPNELAQRYVGVEFKDNILNGVKLDSDYKEDKTSYFYNNIPSIIKDSTTKDEAIKMLGNPNGEFQCPSKAVENMKFECEDGFILLIWTELKRETLNENDKLKRNETRILFDKNSIVKQIQNKIEF